MELPSPPPPPVGATRAPASGLKLMAGIVIVFAVLACYGQWQRSRWSRIETFTLEAAPALSPAPAPNEN